VRALSPTRSHQDSIPCLFSSGKATTARNTGSSSGGRLHLPRVVGGTAAGKSKPAANNQQTPPPPWPPMTLISSDALLAARQEAASRLTAFSAARLQAQTCWRLVGGMEGDVAALEDELARLAGARPPAPQRLRQVQGWLEERRAALSKQRRLLEAKQLDLLKATSELRAAETAAELAEAAAGIHHERGGGEGGEVGGTSDTVASTATHAGAAAAAAAAAVHRRELLGAKAALSKAAADAATQHAAWEQQQARDAASVAAAEAGQRTAKQRLRAGQMQSAPGVNQAADAAQAEEAKRRGALVALKGSLDAVQRRVEAQAQLQRCVFS
jgi:hypothetical protein